MPRFTKIIATVGIRKDTHDALTDKKSRDEFDQRAAAYLTGLIDAGMDVARFNLSFAPADFYIPYIQMARRIADERGKRLGILCDLQGPKVRLGEIQSGARSVKMDEDVRFRTDGVDDCCEGVIPIVYYDPAFDLAKQLTPGMSLNIDEGSIVCRIKKIDRHFLDTTVTKPGELKSRKGVFLQDPDGSVITFLINAITEKDAADITTLRMSPGSVDHIALSFVRDADDIVRLRKDFLAGPLEGKSVIAKIETAAAVADRIGLVDIISAADGVMVARGDLGIERPLPEMLKYQKVIIPLCIHERRFVVVATQMLESMTHRNLPTRAEVSDVANAVYDEADAVMLSGETAVGEFPNESVKMMSDICEVTENHIASADYEEFHTGYVLDELMWGKDTVAASTAIAAVDMAYGSGAKAFLVNSRTGNTAMLVARLRPHMPIAALTDSEDVMGKLTLVRGTYPMLGVAGQGVEETLAFGLDRMRKMNLCGSGDLIIYLSGSKVGIGGVSNQLRVVDVE